MNTTYNRKAFKALFNGKTVKELNCDASNIWYFHMTDGSVVIIEPEIFHNIPLIEAREGLPPNK